MSAHLPPVEGGPNPCLHCPPIGGTLGMGRTIAVGFGEAHLSRDDHLIYREPQSDEGDYWTVQQAEDVAVADPDHDWRIVLDGPLHGETYQRQGPDRWVLVDRNEGFA